MYCCSNCCTLEFSECDRVSLRLTTKLKALRPLAWPSLARERALRGMSNEWGSTQKSTFGAMGKKAAECARPSSVKDSMFTFYIPKAYIFTRDVFRCLISVYAVLV